MIRHLIRSLYVCGLSFALVSCATDAPILIKNGSQPGARPSAPAPGPVPRQESVQGPFQPNAYLQLCNGFSVSNAPPHDAGLWLLDFNPVVVINGVPVAAVPGNEVCLSSAFGPRRGRAHEGIDITARPAPAVYSAAPGRIVEARFSRGYGYQILMDHGRGVYTRYAHFEFFDPAVKVGKRMAFGEPLGRMGKSGNATGVNLHFEILTGNYRNPRGSKGLTPNDPLALPAYVAR